MSYTLPIEFISGPMRIEIDPADGAWTGLSWRGDNLMPLGGRSSFGIEVEGAGICEWTLRAHYETRLSPSGLEATLEYGCDRLPGVRAWQIFDLYGEAGRIERWLHAGSNEGETHVTGAALSIDGLTAGSPERTRASVPGSPVPPGRALDSAALAGASGPIVLFAREAPPLHAAIVPAAEEGGVKSIVSRPGTNPLRLRIDQDFAVDARIGRGETVSLAEQVVRLQNRDWRGAASAIGKLVAQREIAPIAWDRAASEALGAGLADGRLTGRDVQRAIDEYALCLPPRSVAALDAPASSTIGKLLGHLEGVEAGQLRFPTLTDNRLCAVEVRAGESRLLIANLSSEEMAIDEDVRALAGSGGACLPGRIAAWEILEARIDERT